MEHVEKGDLNNDFRTCLFRLNEYGLEAHPRNTTTKELLNYNFSLFNPRNRIITFEERKTSLKYLLGEFIWYISGSSDPAGILPYAKFWDGIRNSGDFDDYLKGTVNSNYGNRLFGHREAPSPFWEGNIQPISQWQETVELLQRDKDTRQAVMNIHVPSDRHIGNKDVPCLAGDTIMMSPGGDITIKELAEKFASGQITSYPIYSWNEETQVTSIQQCVKAWKTGTKKVRRLTFSDGTSLTATHDHLVWQRKMVYDHGHVYHIERPQTKIGELAVGMTLCSVPTFTTGEGRRGIMRCSSSNYADSNRVLEHRLYAEHLYGEEAVAGMDVHHRNGVKNDNRAANLELLTPARHSAEHRLENNPVHRESMLARLSRRLQLRETYEKKGLKVRPISEYLAGADLTMEDVTEFNARRAEIQNLERDYSVNKQHKMLINMTSSAKKVIVAIEELPEIDVYDFMEPVNHNCVLDNGLIVHNCTLTLHWFIRQDKLHLIVNMRSNDVILGFTNDVFQFTMLQEMMLMQLRGTYPNLELGCYYHNAGSMHVYQRHFAMIDKIIADERALEMPMIPMDDCNDTILTGLVGVEAAWQNWLQSNVDQNGGFDFHRVPAFDLLTPYWQNLVLMCFGESKEAMHYIFGIKEQQ
jgi:thymidylate synthase